MLLALTLVGPDPHALAQAGHAVAAAVAAAGAEVKPPSPLGPQALEFQALEFQALGIQALGLQPLGLQALDWLVQAEALQPVRDAAYAAASGYPVDACVQPAENRQKRLFLADMDSTIIGCECLDELADFAGVKPQVAAITERAMRGEIGFEGALRERVAMLRGLPLGTLARCYEERVRLNPGARTLVRTLAAHGVRCVLVSGGFESFTGPVAEAAGFILHQANRLLHDGERLSGQVAEPILGREAKLEALRLHAADLGVAMEQTLAIGDGANDLAMIGAAGLGVAYRAKPVVAQQADARVDHADLTALLYFQGYAAGEFVVD